MTGELLPPPDVLLGLEGFPSWRENQEDAIVKTVESENRFVQLTCPTGFGKSLTYITAAVMSNSRTVILTSTKGLQTQLLKDFEPLGAVDIRGKNNYACKFLGDGTRCDEGPCNAGFHCKLKRAGCIYYDKVREALDSSIVITNYSYWMSVNAFADGIGDFNMMVCDEAHDVPDLVADFLTVRLKRSDDQITHYLPQGDLEKYDIPYWAGWASSTLTRVRNEAEALKEDIVEGVKDDKGARRLLRRLNHFIRELAIMKMATTTDWIMDSTSVSVSIGPLWPRVFASKVLFFHIPTVVMTSATVNGKTMDLVGIKDDVLCMDYPHSFPLKNRMLIHLKTARLNFRSSEFELRMVVSKIDNIIRARLDRKGIIHTTSYKRRDYVIQHSKHSGIMISHGRRDTVDQVAKFKRKKPPIVLVSPSVTTGYDFPYDDCRYQIMVKIPYPNTADKMTKARGKADKEYLSYITMQQLVQACGRGVRSADDFCESFITDDNALWFLTRNEHLAPAWFNDSYRLGVSLIPKPIEL